MASIIDPLKLKRSFTYDPDGRLLSMTLPDGRVITHAYDANVNVKAVTPPGKSAHDFSYNSINLPASYTPPTVVGKGQTTWVPL